jgi:hypothetical protein
VRLGCTDVHAEPLSKNLHQGKIQQSTNTQSLLRQFEAVDTSSPAIASHHEDDGHVAITASLLSPSAPPDQLQVQVQVDGLQQGDDSILRRSICHNAAPQLNPHLIAADESPMLLSSQKVLSEESPASTVSASTYEGHTAHVTLDHEVLRNGLESALPYTGTTTTDRARGEFMAASSVSLSVHAAAVTPTYCSDSDVEEASGFDAMNAAHIERQGTTGDQRSPVPSPAENVERQHSDKVMAPVTSAPPTRNVSVQPYSSLARLVHNKPSSFDSCHQLSKVAEHPVERVVAIPQPKVEHHSGVKLFTKAMQKISAEKHCVPLLPIPCAPTGSSSTRLQATNVTPTPSSNSACTFPDPHPITINPRHRANEMLSFAKTLAGLANAQPTQPPTANSKPADVHM